jgi:hypothetical protein
VLADAGVEHAVRLVDCDFFAGVPRGVDAYVLLRVLHDWVGEDALQTLRRVREAMEPSARLLVSTVSSTLRNEDLLTKFLDVMMLVSAGGRERMAVEWRSILDAAGFRLNALVQAGPGRSVLLTRSPPAEYHFGRTQALTCRGHAALPSIGNFARSS